MNTGRHKMETESETHKKFVTQLPGNLISNIVYFLLHVVIGILLVPYFISTLGIAAYGLIPLVSALTGYVAIVIQSLDTTVSRYLTIDLQKSDYAAANRTFNTAFFGRTEFGQNCVALRVSFFFLNLHRPSPLRMRDTRHNICAFNRRFIFIRNQDREFA